MVFKINHHLLHLAISKQSEWKLEELLHLLFTHSTKYMMNIIQQITGSHQ